MYSDIERGVKRGLQELKECCAVLEYSRQRGEPDVAQLANTDPLFSPRCSSILEVEQRNRFMSVDAACKQAVVAALQNTGTVVVEELFHNCRR